MIKTLGLMIREGRVVNQRLVEYYVKYPYFADDDSPAIEEEQSEAFYEICERFWDLEHSFECSARTAILWLPSSYKTSQPPRKIKQAFKTVYKWTGKPSGKRATTSDRYPDCL